MVILTVLIIISFQLFVSSSVSSTSMFLKILSLFIYFAVLNLQLRHVNSQLQHVRCSSLIRDRNQAPCFGSVELATGPPEKSSISVLQFSHYRSFTSLGRFLPRYLIIFDAIVNEIVSLISCSDFSLLVYRKKCSRFLYINFVSCDFTVLIDEFWQFSGGIFRVFYVQYVICRKRPSYLWTGSCKPTCCRDFIAADDCSACWWALAQSCCVAVSPTQTSELYTGFPGGMLVQFIFPCSAVVPRTNLWARIHRTGGAGGSSSTYYAEMSLQV